MLARDLAPTIDELGFEPHKIAIVSGPRQCGKTTMAKMLLAERGAGSYHNWDDPEFRRHFAKQRSAGRPATQDSRGSPPKVVAPRDDFRPW